MDLARTLDAPTAAPAVGGTAKALPPHRYDQTELAELALELFPKLTVDPAVLKRFFRRVAVGGRNLSLPAERYAELDGLGARNDAWIRVATELAEEAGARALADAGLEAADIDQLLTTTVTGVAVPSLDARLMNRMGFRSDLKRVPLFGLGCLGGAAGIARAADYLRGHPDHAVLLVSVELCSLTVQPEDTATKNLIAVGLFGDGAAALVMRGPDHEPRGGGGRPTSLRPGSDPQVVDSCSIFFHDTERVMGWDVGDGGFEVVLDPSVPELVSAHVPDAVDELLAAHGLAREDIATWVSHPGGPAVIAALEEGLDLEPDALAPTRDHLKEVGNLSSSSVLFLLDAARRRHPPRGSHGLVLAMGPGFCAELVLIRW